MVYAIKSIDLKTKATINLHVVCMRCQLLIQSNKIVLKNFKSFLMIVEKLRKIQCRKLDFTIVENELKS